MEIMIEMVSVAKIWQFQDFRDSPSVIASSTSCFASLRECWLDIFFVHEVANVERSNTSIGKVK